MAQNRCPCHQLHNDIHRYLDETIKYGIRGGAEITGLGLNANTANSANSATFPALGQGFSLPSLVDPNQGNIQMAISPPKYTFQTDFTVLCKDR